jgi:hypothetical protein
VRVAAGPSAVVAFRIWCTIAALTAVAVILVLAPTHRLSDAVIYTLVIVDFISIGLVTRDERALWAPVAFAASSSAAWYIDFLSTDADDGPSTAWFSG